jgi:hypothetical protein
MVARAMPSRAITRQVADRISSRRASQSTIFGMITSSTRQRPRKQRRNKQRRKNQRRNKQRRNKQRRNKQRRNKRRAHDHQGLFFCRTSV